MSKRHRKTKEMMSTYSGDFDPADFADPSFYEAPRSRRPRGKEKRQSLKRAYYDD